MPNRPKKEKPPVYFMVTFSAKPGPDIMIKAVRSDWHRIIMPATRRLGRQITGKLINRSRRHFSPKNDMFVHWGGLEPELWDKFLVKEDNPFYMAEIDARGDFRIIRQPVKGSVPKEGIDSPGQ